MNHGRAIRIAMAAAGIGGVDLAPAIGMAPSSLSLICRGLRGISLKRLDDVCRALDMPRVVIDILASEPEQLDEAASLIAFRWIINAKGLRKPIDNDTIIEATNDDDTAAAHPADFHGDRAESARVPVSVDQECGGVQSPGALREVPQG